MFTDNDIETSSTGESVFLNITEVFLGGEKILLRFNRMLLLCVLLNIKNNKRSLHRKQAETQCMQQLLNNNILCLPAKTNYK